MTSKPTLIDRVNHNRQTLRWEECDYAVAGAYFVTICTHERRRLFGSISDGVMTCNALGRLVEHEWRQTVAKRKSVALDAFVVMPNHFHAILFIADRTPARRGVLPYAPTVGVWQYAPTLRSPSQTLGAIVRGFKGAATARVNALRRTPGSPVWQRNYYDRVIRDDEELMRIREYIKENPANWARDDYNPSSW